MTTTGFVRKNALRNKLRSVFTVLSVSFTLLVLTVMLSMWQAFYLTDSTGESARRLIVGPAVSRGTPLPISYKRIIRMIPRVRQVADLTWLGGHYKDERPENDFAQFGTDPNILFDVYLDLHISADQLAAWQKDRAGCVVDAELARRYGWQIGDRIVIKGGAIPADLELTIRGIFSSAEPGGTDEIFFNETSLEETYPKMKGFTGWYAVRTDSPETVAQVADAIDNTFRNSEYPTKSSSANAFAASFLEDLGNLKAFIFSICLAVTFATSLVSATTMAMSIRERSREAAVLRVLGFTRRQVMGIFVCESVGLAILGSAGAVLMAALLIPMIANSPSGGMYLNGVTITVPVSVVVIVIAITLGGLSSLVPAYRVSYQDITRGLRHIG
jgi:putative ABC transport system permease protein